MGVTLGRRVVKGGTFIGSVTGVNLGPSLAPKVNNFIGIAGANWGLYNCMMMSVIATCNPINGFYPGMMSSVSLSKHFAEMNNDGIQEGIKTYAFFSTADELIGGGDKVFGRYTSEWPTSQKSKISSTLSHMNMRDKTAADQYNTCMGNPPVMVDNEHYTLEVNTVGNLIQ